MCHGIRQVAPRTEVKMTMKEHKAEGALHFVLEEKLAESVVDKLLAIPVLKHLPGSGKRRKTIVGCRIVVGRHRHDQKILLCGRVVQSRC